MDIESDLVNLTIVGFTILALLVTHADVFHALGQMDGRLALWKPFAGGKEKARS